MLEVKNDEDEMFGLHKGNGPKWSQHEYWMYIEIQRKLNETVHKIHLTADPSCFNGEDTIAGIIFCWEVNAASYGICQILPAGGFIRPDEIDASESLRAKMWAKDTERNCAYREWQAMSNMITNSVPDVSMADFELPSDVHVQRVKPSQQRLTDQRDPQVNRIYLRDKVDGTTVEVLPAHHNPGQWYQLTVSLDSGAVGRSGGSFVKNSLGYNVFLIYDIIHRLIRDIRLSLDHGVDGELLRAVLHMTYVQSINQKPFGTGVFSEKKKEGLEDYLIRENSESESFRDWATHWAYDLGRPCESDDDFKKLWQQIPDLKSWTNRGDVIKGARWFSLNAKYKEEKTDFWPNKGLLTHLNHKNAENTDAVVVEDPVVARNEDPRKELKRLKDNEGGTLLAQRLLTHWLHDNFHIYYVSTKAVWSFYTDRVTQTKSPMSGLKAFASYAKGSWQSEIRDMFATALEDPGHMKFCGLDWSAPAANTERHRTLASTLFDFNIRLAANRSWSMAIYESPPFCYADLLNAKRDTRKTVVAQMCSDASLLYSYEKIAHLNPDVECLVSTVQELFCSAVRVLLATYERDKWSPDSENGQKHLATMLIVVPDNKAIEDVLQHIRDLQRQKRSMVSSGAQSPPRKSGPKSGTTHRRR